MMATAEDGLEVDEVVGCSLLACSGDDAARGDVSISCSCCCRWCSSSCGGVSVTCRRGRTHKAMSETGLWRMGDWMGVERMSLELRSR